MEDSSRWPCWWRSWDAAGHCVEVGWDGMGVRWNSGIAYLGVGVEE